MKDKLKCPECATVIGELCLYSYPAHYETTKCSSCGFQLTYKTRKNSYLPVTQVELDSYKKENK